jgi:hypothetical protein
MFPGRGLLPSHPRKINVASIAAMHTPLPRWVDAVEKVGPLIGINALGIFDPAETGRRFGFTAA